MQNEKEKTLFSEILKYVDKKKKKRTKNVFQDILFKHSDEIFYYDVVSLEIYTSNGLKKKDRLNLEHCCLSLQREVTLSVLIEDRLKHDITFQMK